MKVPEILSRSKETRFSFELLPPLKGSSIQVINEAIDPLMEFNPLNINITYHQSEVEYRRLPGGLLEKRIIRKRPGTIGIAAAIMNKYHVMVVPHLICGGFTREETEDALIDLHFLGIRNILALRGDPQKGEKYFIPEEGGHAHTLTLVEQIINMNRGIYLDENLKNAIPTDFCVGVAGYPEKHFEAPNMEADLRHLKAKIDAGAEYIVTQMFFDNRKYLISWNDVVNPGLMYLSFPVLNQSKPCAILSSFPGLSILTSLKNSSAKYRNAKPIRKQKRWASNFVLPSQRNW
jgi:methylenetetrahydrofolate reductase (NADPH)